MKANIHPEYHTDTKVTCACGNTFTTGSVLAAIRVEICSACHPFYTGQQKFVDTLGQVERFQKRTEEAKVKQEKIKEIKAQREAKVRDQKSDKPSLKDLLMQARKQLSS